MIDSLIEKVMANFAEIRSLPEINCAASLAYHEVISFLDTIWMCDMDLSSVPNLHLAALVACPTEEVSIRHVTGCNLLSIINSIYGCNLLRISEQSLNGEEAMALLNLMRRVENGVETVTLGKQVILDINTITEYDGQGECRAIRCLGDTATRYREDLCAWARRLNWDVDLDNGYLMIEK